MRYNLSTIAKQLKLSFDGADIPIEGIHTLKEATSLDLSFFSDKKYLSELPHTQAGAVLIEAQYASKLPSTTIALITDEPYLHLAYASKFFAYTPTINEGSVEAEEGCCIDRSVRFGEGVTLGKGVTIMAGCYLGDGVSVGDHTILYPNVTLYHHSIIGNNVIIHAGSVIGCDGYGFAHTKQGEHIKIYQNGHVLIESDVEIGANCTIDRAVFGTTRIRRGTKLDNLIQIAHNCDVGEHTLMAAQVGLAGSTTLGRNVVMGGQSATAGHLAIGAFATVAGKGGVTKSLEGGKTYAGFPAMEIRAWRKLQAILMRLLKRR